MRAKYLVRKINGLEFLWLGFVTPTSWERDLVAGRLMKIGAPVTGYGAENQALNPLSEYSASTALGS